jgi:hypothetical protein
MTGQWIKASRSASTGNCVEMRDADGRVQVRDSKNPTGAVLHLTATGFGIWVAAAKGGELDHLV